MIRFIRGFIGCWLGLAVPFFLIFYADDLSSFHLANFLAVTNCLAIPATLATAILERSQWRFATYLLPSAIIIGLCVGYMMAPWVLLLGPHEGNQLLYMASFVGAGSILGAIMGGAYRLCAGVKL